MKRVAMVAAIVLFAVTLHGHAYGRFKEHRHGWLRPVRLTAARFSERGTATWYTGSHGACTPHFPSNYAAHLTLPCGTIVHVCTSSRCADAVIEDRGPYGGGIIDLSPSVFQQLAPLGAGRIAVIITTSGSTDPSPPPSAPPAHIATHTVSTTG